MAFAIVSMVLIYCNILTLTLLGLLKFTEILE